jgi:hypothetical protein
MFSVLWDGDEKKKKQQHFGNLMIIKFSSYMNDMMGGKIHKKVDDERIKSSNQVC